MIQRKLLLATALVSPLMGIAGHALAQQAPASSGTQVGEVVVTAQRRAERLVDVPITVAVMTNAQLAQRGVTDVIGLQRMTAGLQMAMQGNFPEPAIRGVSTALQGGGLPANVAFYVDGVYQPSQGATLFDLPDVQDVEVLKGPQGALYGESAEGGAIVITTLEPKFKWQGKLNVSYGNYNDVQVSGFETGPISDSISQSLAGNFEKHDGFSTNVFTGERNKGLQDELLRGKLLFQPNDKVSITFTAYYDYHFDDAAISGQPFYLPGYGYLGIARDYDRTGHLLTGDPPGAPSIIAGLKPSDYGSTPAPPFKLKTWGADLTGVFDMGLGKLTWQSSFSSALTHAATWQSFSPLLTTFDSYQFPSTAVIEEGDFVSRPFKPIEAIGPVEFSTGLFYMHWTEGTNNTYTAYDYLGFGLPFFFPLPLATNRPYPTPVYNEVFSAVAVRDEFAGYLEGTFHVTPNFIVTAGGRYDTNTEHAYFDSCLGANRTNSPYGPNNGLLPTASCPGGSGVSSHAGNIGAPTAFQPLTEMVHSPASWVNFAPRVTARYKLTPDSNVYFSYSEGYRSGGFDLSGLAQPPFKPETLDAYEAGFKGTLLHQLSLDLAGFYYNYKNKQEGVDLGTSYVVDNAASATMDGVDLDADWRATSQLTLNASVEWLQAKFDKFTNALIWEPSPIYLGLLIETPNVNYSHHDVEHSPKWSGTVGGDYHIDTQVGRFNANVSVYYASKQFENPGSLVYQNAYATVDAQLGYAPASQPNLQLVLWGKNLTNTYYIQSDQPGATADGIIYSPPRQLSAPASNTNFKGAVCNAIQPRAAQHHV